MFGSTLLDTIPFPATMSLVSLAALCSASVIAVLTVDGISWVRTSSIRRGDRPPWRAVDGARHSVHRTSALTLLPAAAGATLGAGGAVYAAFFPHAHSSLAWSCVAAGLFVTEEGVRKRVTCIEATPDGITVAYARSPPKKLPWSRFGSLRPPGWPWGGWRLLSNGPGPTLTLMPTDLWPHELVLLELVIVRAAPRFDGRAWVGRDLGSSGDRDGPLHHRGMDQAVEEVRAGRRRSERVVD